MNILSQRIIRICNCIRHSCISGKVNRRSSINTCWIYKLHVILPWHTGAHFLCLVLCTKCQNLCEDLIICNMLTLYVFYESVIYLLICWLFYYLCYWKICISKTSHSIIFLLYMCKRNVCQCTMNMLLCQVILWVIMIPCIDILNLYILDWNGEILFNKKYSKEQVGKIIF